MYYCQNNDEESNPQDEPFYDRGPEEPDDEVEDAPPEEEDLDFCASGEDDPDTFPDDTTNPDESKYDWRDKWVDNSDEVGDEEHPNP